MEIRGLRKCRDCGGQWSYYETGSVECPDCGSVRSVGVDERTTHTAAPATLDLAPYREAVGEGDVAGVADDLSSALREYVRKRGFIDAGELRPLDDAYLAASELLHAVDVYTRLRAPSDDEQLYVLRLLGAADDGDRPAPDEVPPSMREARGLGYATALSDYRREVREWVEDPDPPTRQALESLDERIRRVEALQGDVDPRIVESLVAAARDVARYLTEDDEAALATARDRLSRSG